MKRNKMKKVFADSSNKSNKDSSDIGAAQFIIKIEVWIFFEKNKFDVSDHTCRLSNYLVYFSKATFTLWLEPVWPVKSHQMTGLD